MSRRSAILNLARTHRSIRIRIYVLWAQQRYSLHRTYAVQRSGRHCEVSATFSIHRSPADRSCQSYSVYQSSIDYTVAAYGVYAASATGGNDFMRDFLSGIAALYSVPRTYLQDISFIH